MVELTCKQFKVYEFIKNYIKDNEYPPSCKNISEHFSINIKSAHDYLKAIERKGYIQRINGVSRGLKVLK